MNNLDLSTLDPNIRRVVAFLRSHGFETTDSGDGCSKPEDERTIEGAHVVMVVRQGGDPCRVIYAALRLRDELKAIGIEIHPQNPEGLPSIQATYDPADGSAVLLLTGVDDSMLEEKKENE